VALWYLSGASSERTNFAAELEVRSVPLSVRSEAFFDGVDRYPFAHVDARGVIDLCQKQGVEGGPLKVARAAHDHFVHQDLPTHLAAAQFDALEWLAHLLRVAVGSRASKLCRRHGDVE
jgi:hypothetical protein